MNRRSFLSSLAALSLPAVVAGKVAEIAGYGPKLLCDWAYTGKPCGIPGCQNPYCRPSLDELVVYWDQKGQLWVSAEHFQPITNAIVHYRPSCTVTPIG